MPENPLGIRPSQGDGPDVMAIWTIYQNPRDLPGFYVARRFEFDPETHQPFPCDRALATRDLEALRDAMQDMGLVCIQRQEHDEPHIVESWI